MALINVGPLYTKDPGEENIALSFDWTDELAGETILTSTWAVTPSGLTLASETADKKTTTVRVSAGTAGVDYRLVNTITTSGGTPAPKLKASRTVAVRSA